MCNETIIVTYFWEMECLNCQTPVPQTPGKRPKLYCSETCRVAFFRQKKAGDGVKKGKGRPRKHIPISPQKIYDAKKWPDTIMDEEGKYAIGVDPSTEPSKTVVSVYKKGKLNEIHNDLSARIAENNKPENKARILKERNTLTPLEWELNEYGVSDNPPSEETDRTVIFEPSIGKVTITEPAYPKDWDTMGRIDKMKWLTANRT